MRQPFRRDARPKIIRGSRVPRVPEGEGELPVSFSRIEHAVYGVGVGTPDGAAVAESFARRHENHVWLREATQEAAEPTGTVNILTALSSGGPMFLTPDPLSERKLDAIDRAGRGSFPHDFPDRPARVLERVLGAGDPWHRGVERTPPRDGELHFRSLVEALPDPVVIYDEEGRTVFVNDSMLKLMKAESRRDLIGTHFATFVDPPCRPALYRNFDAVMRGGVVIKTPEYIRIALDGERIPVEANVTAILWQGRPALLAALRDVSGRNEMLARARRSEGRATAILQNVAEAVIITDRNGIITTFNLAAETMFGYAAEEVVGRAVKSLLVDAPAFSSGQPVPPDPLSAAASSAGRRERELMCRRKNGVHFPAEATTGTARVDGETMVIAALRDISERKAGLMALRESEERFRWAFETAPHGMALVAPDGRYLQVNEALCTLLGYSREELLALDFRAITHPDDVKTGYARLRQLISGETRCAQNEKRYIRKDGTLVWALSAVAMVRGEDEGPRYFIVQVFDLTDRKRAEEEQERLEGELQHFQKLESLGTLSAGIAHEFNNLLLPISGMIELSLRAIGDNDGIRDNLEIALENVRRSAALVNKILSFSRVEQGEMVDADLLSEIERAVALLRATRPATVDIVAELQDVGKVRIDRAQLSQLVLNLGVNAIDAIEGHVGRIEFRLSAEKLRKRRGTTTGPLPAGRYAKLSVSDSGCGMDAATVARIFEPFFTTKGVGEGTGMGLSLVHGAVRAHGGAIDVDSAPGAGTTFDIYVPLDRKEPAKGRKPVRRNAASPARRAKQRKE